MPYPELMIRPMREELSSIGFTELKSAENVETWMQEAGSGLSLLVINSVCGCAAGMARPGVRLALERAGAPDRMGTVFAGQDVEATHRARAFFPDIPPSSPSMAVMRDGELVFFLPRHRIEGRTAEDVAGDIHSALEEARAAATT